MSIELSPARLGTSGKVRLAARIALWFVAVHLLLRREPLPVVVERLTVTDRRRTGPMSMSPAKLGWIVSDLLRIRSHRARCLVSSLVHYRLLSAQGLDPELVIGLVPEASSADAHAWIEISGIDVGPPPGKGRHSELVRYGGASGSGASGRSPRAGG